VRTPAATNLEFVEAVTEGDYMGPDGIRRFIDDLLNAFEVRHPDREFRSLASGVRDA
jgi:hypothetical protein